MEGHTQPLSCTGQQSRPHAPVTGEEVSGWCSKKFPQEQKGCISLNAVSAILCPIRILRG